MLIALAVGLAVGLALRPSVDHLATKIRSLVVPQEPSIIYFNGTLISAVQRCVDTTALIDTALVAPPAAPATIPDGIATYARPALDLCKHASNVVAHRPDIGTYCRELEGAYNATVLPSGDQSTDWRYSHKIHCHTMVYNSGSGIRTLARHLQHIDTMAGSIYGSDNDLDEALPSLEARLQRGETSDMMATQIQRRLHLIIGNFQIIRAKADARGPPLATMINKMNTIADAFDYEMSKKGFAAGAGHVLLSLPAYPRSPCVPRSLNGLVDLHLT